MTAPVVSAGHPGTLVHNGIRKFVDWHREFYATRELMPTNQD